MTGIRPGVDFIPNKYGLVLKSAKSLSEPNLSIWWKDIKYDRYALSGLCGWTKDERDLDGWLDFAYSTKFDVTMFYGPEDERLGWFWVTDARGRAGFIHFNFLAAAQPIAVDIGKFVLGILWLAGYECLAGLTPRHLRNAVGYARAVGGKIICQWPGACYWADKDVWEPGVLSQFLPGCEGLYIPLSKR